MSRIVNPDASALVARAAAHERSLPVVVLLSAVMMFLVAGVTGTSASWVVLIPAVMIAVWVAASFRASLTCNQITTSTLWDTYEAVRGSDPLPDMVRYAAQSRAYTADQLLREFNGVIDDATSPADRAAAHAAGWAAMSSVLAQLHAAARELDNGPLTVRAEFSAALAAHCGLGPADQRVVDELSTDGLSTDEVASLVASSMAVTAEQVATYLRVSNNLTRRLQSRNLIAAP